MKHDLLQLRKLRQRSQYSRADVLPKAPDKVQKFSVIFRLDPGHILPGLPKARFNAPQADFHGIVQKEHGVAAGQPPFQRPGIVAVQYEAVLYKNFIQCSVKFLAGDGRPVGPVIEHIQIVQRQAGSVLQSPRKGAFAAARTADDTNAVHRHSFLSATSMVQSFLSTSLIT